MDLVVDLNFRMDTSALYSDIVLPAATWYEKSDLNSTDMHSFVHPLSEAVPPCWESKSDWDIFKAISEKFSELSERHFPDEVRDLVATPLAHDTPAEIAQPEMKDWLDRRGRGDPGKTMPGLKVVTRNYKDLYKQYISLGPNVRRTASALTARATSARSSTTSSRSAGRSPGTARPIPRSIATSTPATPCCGWPRSATESWPTAPTRTWRRRSACR